MAYDLDVLEQGCVQLGIELSRQREQQFIDFYEFLAEKK